MLRITLIFMVLGAKAVISFCIRSPIPGYIVVPPESTLLAYRSLRMSISHFIILLYVVSWIPADSIPGWKEVFTMLFLFAPFFYIVVNMKRRLTSPRSYPSPVSLRKTPQKKKKKNMWCLGEEGKRQCTLLTFVISA